MPLKTNTTLYASATTVSPPTPVPVPDPPAPVPDPPEATPYPDGEPSMGWKKAVLIAWAMDNGIEVSEGETKAEILESIEAAGVEG